MSGEAVRKAQSAEDVNSTYYYKVLEGRAISQPQKKFIHVKGQWFTYADLNSLANSIGRGLLTLGLEPGARVATMLVNSDIHLATWFGCEKARLAWVPINVAQKGSNLEYLLHQSGAEALILEPDILPVVEATRHKTPGLKYLIVNGNGTESSNKNGYLPIQAACSQDTTNLNLQVASHDLTCIIYTSGTTGPPKGVVHRQGRASFPRLWSTLVGYRPDDRLYTCLPLYHANAQVMTVGIGLVDDLPVTLGTRFSASRFWSEVRVADATVFNYIGGMLPILFKQPPHRDDKENPVRFALGAAAPANIWSAFEQRFDLRLIEFWGTTEGGLTLNAEGRHGSIGRAVEAYNEVRVVDEHDRACAPGEIGEIVSRFSDHEKTCEYFGMSEASREKMRAGWLRTGDLGYRDEEGYLYFVDRKKDCIRRRGENISSWEVERIVGQHPEVLEVAAIGVPSDLGEEDVKICAVLVPGASLDPEALFGYCEANLAAYMVPRYIELYEELPKTPTLRIEKHKLKSNWISASTWDGERNRAKQGRTM